MHVWSRARFGRILSNDQLYCFFNIHVTGNQQDEEGHSGEQLPGTHDKSTSNSLQSVASDDDLTETGSKKGSDKIKRGEELQQPAQGYLIRIVWCSFMPLVIILNW